MDIAPQILFGHVMHKRFFPKVNAFRYKIYYLSLPLSQLNKKIENKFFKLNRFGLLSFYNRDHGYRNNEHPENWARDVLKKHKVMKADGEIVLVTMPRVLGYVFNPVSFWYCYDEGKKLRAVICEVNNTFGETHSYICAYDDEREINAGDVLEGKKVFHVSPFLEREGRYKFRFSSQLPQIGVNIDLYDEKDQKKLITALNGSLEGLTKNTAMRAFLRYPLVTFKAIYLIHWQAIKLLVKRIKYVPKPVPLADKVTRVNK